MNDASAQRGSDRERRPAASSATPRLIIVGAGGHGRVVADAAECSGDWGDICFLDDLYPALPTSGPWPVRGSSDLRDFEAAERDCFVVGVGNASTRVRLLSALIASRHSVVSIVHPAAIVSRHSTVGAGSVVFAGACVNVGSILGEGVIVNTGATVDHDCTLGRGVHVCPGAHLAGDVTVGDRAWIGIGACVKQGITIAADAVVGAGAVVVNDVPQGSVVTGVPARPQVAAR